MIVLFMGADNRGEKAALSTGLPGSFSRLVPQRASAVDALGGAGRFTFEATVCLHLAMA
ncbi:MAG: hypothetical protein WA973_07875 [Mesorhizobium sp.]